MAMTEGQLREYATNVIKQNAQDEAVLGDYIDGDPRLTDSDTERLNRLIHSAVVHVSVTWLAPTDTTTEEQR